MSTHAHIVTSYRNKPTAEFVSYSGGFTWARSLMTIDQAQPAGMACRVGNGDRFVCHSLSDCRPPGERAYVCVFICVFCLCACVCGARLATLGYPLQAVQKTNKPHFNLRNINFPPDGKLIMAQELSRRTLFATQCHCTAAMSAADQCIGIWLVFQVPLTFSEFSDQQNRVDLSTSQVKYLIFSFYCLYWLWITRS